MKHWKTATIVLVVLSGGLFCAGCGKGQEASGPPSMEERAAKTHQQPQRQSVAPQDGTEKQPPSVRTDQIRVKPKSVVFERQEAVSINLKAGEGHFMKRGPDGELVLEGLAKDPDAFRMPGEVAGTVTSQATGDAIARYSFRVVRILPGRSERMSDCFLLCQGTYWVPDVPSRQGIDWKSVPPTVAEYFVPPSGFGLMFRADGGREAQRSEDKVSDSSSEKPPTKEGFVLSASMKPLVFGAGSSLTIAAGPQSASPEPKTRSTEADAKGRAAPPEVVEAIETTIAVSIKPFSFNPCPISERLQAFVKKYDLETAFGVAMAGYAAVMKEKGIAIKLKDDWGMPFAVKSDRLPEVKFRRGQIGIVAEEICVKEGTEALVEGKAYEYKGQKWVAVEGQTSEINATGAQLPASSHWHEEQVGVLNSNVLVQSITVSPDGRSAAWIEKDRDGQLVVVGASKGKRYSGISPTLRFSPDSKRLAYLALHQGHIIAVVDGAEIGAPKDTSGSVAHVYFAPDLQRVVSLVAVKDGKEVKECFYVVNGAKQLSYDVVDCPPTFSPDSKRFAYYAFKGEQAFVIVDGKHYGPFENISSSIRFSPDSQRFACVVVKSGKTMVILDGKEGKQFDGLAEDGVIFSPDSKRVAYGAWSGGKMVVCLDDQVLGPYDNLGVDSLVFSPDSQTFSYAAVTDGKMRAVINGRAGAEFEAVTELRFSDAGHLSAYLGLRNGKMIPVIAGKQIGEYERILRPGIVLSPDGRHFAFIGEMGDSQVLVRDGKEHDRGGKICGLCFSDNAPLAAWVVRTHEQWIVKVDGRSLVECTGFSDGNSTTITMGVGFAGDLSELPELPYGPDVARSNPIFAPNGKTLVSAFERNGKFFVAANTLISGPYDGFLKGASFHCSENAKTCWILAVRDMKVLRCTLMLGPDAR